MENCRGGILCCGHIQWESASFLADASGTVFEHSGLGPMLQYSKKNMVAGVLYMGYLKYFC